MVEGEDGVETQSFVEKLKENGMFVWVFLHVNF